MTGLQNLGTLADKAQKIVENGAGFGDPSIVATATKPALLAGIAISSTTTRG